MTLHQPLNRTIIFVEGTFKMGPILTSLLSAGVWDLAKKIVESQFGGDYENLAGKMIAAYDQTAKAYHGEYGNQFGDENNSFVCRQVNIERILRCLFMGDPQSLDSIQLDGNSFDGSQAAPPSVLLWFKERLKKEIGKNWLLDKIVETKKQRAEVEEINARIKEIHELVKGNENTNADWREPIYDPGHPDSFLPEQGVFYHYTLSNGAIIEYVVKGTLAYLTYIFPDGAEAYYEVDENGSVKYGKFPYPLGEYKFDIPHSMILEQKTQASGAISSTRISLKYGGHITITDDLPNNNRQLSIQTRFSVDHSKRIIKILDPRVPPVA